MDKTIIEILKESLTGKQVMVYIYDSFSLHTKQRVKHYYAYDEEVEAYKNEEAWSDIKKSNQYLEIIDVSGHYDSYEGNYLDLIVNDNGKDGYIMLEVDKPIKIKDSNEN